MLFYCFPYFHHCSLVDRVVDDVGGDAVESAEKALEETFVLNNAPRFYWMRA